jgi:esterase/lipase superfamily enzyme
MNIEYQRWYSPSLGQDMELKVYGWYGKPVIVFPAQCGRFFEFEDFGMINACENYIESGQIKIITVDSVDSQSWANWEAHPADRARRHQDFDRYITQEVVPFVYQHCGQTSEKMITTGVSMGGYHSANFFFRHPDIFDTLVSISGLYRLDYFTGGYMDENIYFNSPLDYLPELNDAWYLDQYKKSRILFIVGQGAWEDAMLDQIRQMRDILESKGVPVWADIWGYDVNHDWPWWRKMWPHALYHLHLPSAW